MKMEKVSVMELVGCGGLRRDDYVSRSSGRGIQIVVVDVRIELATVEEMDPSSDQ